MALARHKLTGLVEDIRDEILDHPILGKIFNRIREGASDKPLVSYQVGDKAPIEDTDATDEEKAEKPADTSTETPAVTETPGPVEASFGDPATTTENA